MLYERQIGEALMRVWVRRSIGLLAIYVIALATILSAFSAPRPASAAFDPFSVICHSGADSAAASDQAPAQPAPTKVCDHCTLCGAAAAAVLAFNGVVIDTLAPAAEQSVLRPAQSLPPAEIGGSPRQAQGPPSNA
jgi:hypothetical protein